MHPPEPPQPTVEIIPFDPEEPTNEPASEAAPRGVEVVIDGGDGFGVVKRVTDGSEDDHRPSYRDTQKGRGAVIRF